MDTGLTRTLWGVGAALLALVLVLFHVGGITLTNVAVKLLFFASTAVMTVFIPARSNEPILSAIVSTMECYALSALLAFDAALASYLIAGASHGYADATLAQMDAALGFDWAALYHWTQARPWAIDLGIWAYRSIFYTPLVVFACLCFCGLRERALRLMCAQAICLGVCLAFFAAMPAQSAFAHYIGAGGERVPTTGVNHVAIIESMRGGLLREINTRDLFGMITFPSFHAVSAALFIWAAWPLRILRLPVLVVNLAMLAATPIEGTHYFVDVLAGLTLAGLGVTVVNLSAIRAAAITRAGRGRPHPYLPGVLAKRGAAPMIARSIAPTT